MTTYTCGACHRIFADLDSFDTHRKYHRCNNPEKQNMHNTGGVWHLTTEPPGHLNEQPNLPGL